MRTCVLHRKGPGEGTMVLLWGMLFIGALLCVPPSGFSQSVPPPFRYSYRFGFPTNKGEGERAIGKPRTLAINSTGQVYVVVPYAKEVRAYSPQGGYLFSFGQKKTGEQERGTFSEPSGITIDTRDVIYISDLDRDMVLMFNPDGTFIGEFPLFQPKGKPDACAPFIQYNPHKNLLYIPDSCTHRVGIYTPKGEFIISFGDMGTELGAFGGPANCAVNSDGEVYVVDPGNFRVQRFSPNHQPIDAFGVKGTKEGEFVRPYDIGIDSAGRVYVSDFVLKAIQVFGRTGRFMGIIQEKDFDEPLGIACSREGRVYIVDGRGQKVHVFQID
ncbi:MAG: NHL repeat-containing protein [bacterium]